MRRHPAFTLIELLIVVAVIAILAAIALPNFLEAQTRAKVTRALADMRTMQVGVEAYAVDTNVYPRFSYGFMDFWPRDYYEGQGHARRSLDYTLGPWITTPVAYIARFDLHSPFNTQGVSVSEAFWFYNYTQPRFARVVTERNGFPTTGFGILSNPGYFQETYGGYELHTRGPGVTSTLVVFPFNPLIAYDPTNGTGSFGYIVRSQRSPNRVEGETP